MQLKHSQSFHKFRCWKSHQLEVVGGKKKKKRKKLEKNAGSTREGGHPVPTSVNSPGRTSTTKIFEIDLEEYFIKKAMRYLW